MAQGLTRIAWNAAHDIFISFQWASDIRSALLLWLCCQGKFGRLWIVFGLICNDTCQEKRRMNYGPPRDEDKFAVFLLGRDLSNLLAMASLLVAMASKRFNACSALVQPHAPYTNSHAARDGLSLASIAPIALYCCCQPPSWCCFRSS